MRSRVLLDTGPLVALLRRDDEFHEWVAALIPGLDLPFLTCEAVLSEACFLVSDLPGGSESVLAVFDRGFLRIALRLDDEAVAVSRLMARYTSVPMSLADACLVRMAEQHANSVVLTLDSNFKLYRMHGRQVIPTIMPQR